MTRMLPDAPMALTDEKLVFLDLETTGGNASRNRIIEIGLLEVQAGEVLSSWQRLVDPGCSLPPFIRSYTGIDEDMLAGAPRFEQLADELLTLLDGAVLVAHNARFDYGFLRNEFRRLDTMLRMPVLCTVKLARALYPGEQSYSLDALIERHGLVCDARHRALGDARAMFDFYRLALTEHGKDKLAAAAAPQLKRPSLPPALDPALVDRLPNAPGVYLFFDASRRLLYIGKSINLRQRVLSHFSADHSQHKDMQMSRQLADIEWLEMPGELGALLTEARLIKERAPVYNRRLRRQNSLYTWSLDTAPEYHQPRLLSQADLTHFDPDEHFGVFRNRRSAKLALGKLCSTDGLCPQRCGLERGAGPCFAYQLGRCRGACAGRESAVLHNLRLAAALTGLRVSAWPFEGVIGIRETDLVRGRQAIHVFDNWCWLGSAESEDGLRALRDGAHEPGFDLDVYRILRRWLARRGDKAEILPLDSLLSGRFPAAEPAA